MTRSLAYRRHHRERIKAKRIRQFRKYGKELVEDPKSLGKLIRTPKPCSCAMCGNPRKHFGEKTLQEKKQKLDKQGR
jgi:hypothetical protein